MKHTVKFLETLGSEHSDVAVFDFARLNILGRLTANNIPQLEVGCPPSPFRVTKCHNSTALSSFFHKNGYITAKSVTGVVRVNHDDYEPEPGIERHEDHLFQVQPNLDDCKGLIHHWGGILNGERRKWLPTDKHLDAHCLFGHFPTKYFLDNLEALFQEYPDVPKYFFSHILSNHIPEQSGLLNDDERLADTLSRLSLDNTFVLLTSDHGLTYGDWSNTPLGRLDHKNPMAFLLAPRKYLTGNMEKALLYNQHSLITHYDLHVTLKELALFNFDNPNIPPRRWNQYWSNPPLGESLLKPIDAHRTCHDAGIHPMWCLCSNNVFHPVDDLSSYLIYMLLEEMEAKMQDPNNQCYKLTKYNQQMKLYNNQYTVTDNLYYQIAFYPDPFSSKVTSARVTFRGFITKGEKGFKVESIFRSSEYNREKCHSKVPKESREFCVCLDGNFL